MLKNLLIGTLAAVIIVAVGASAYAAFAAPSTAEIQMAPVVERVPANPLAANSAEAFVEENTAVLAVTATALTADEIAGLLYMYEEEKLARDVYNTLYTLWGQPTFQNIAASEQAHMDAVGTLLTNYAIPIPGTAAGVFNDPSLQALFDDLVAKGSLSLADAMKVGATIEEVDIIDLQSRLAQTTNTDIQLIYTNLMNGSYNHLRNFVNVLNRQTGEVYQPQYLTDDLYQSILSGSQGNGRSWGGSGTYPGDSTKRGKGFHGGK
jgi:hypothetical protein